VNKRNNLAIVTTLKGANITNPGFFFFDRNPGLVIKKEKFLAAAGVTRNFQPETF